MASEGADFRGSTNPVPIMKRTLFSGAVLAGLFLVSTSLSAAEWQDLFDGKTLDGWVQRGGQAKYAVEDGMIVGTTVPKTPNSFLCTERDYSDFILELEFKVDTGLNSGIQIRSQSKEDYKNGRVHGYQVEIDPSDRAWSGGIYDEARRGWLNNLKDNEPARKAFRPAAVRRWPRRESCLGRSTTTAPPPLPCPAARCG